jgi:type II secretory pathway pseudopilin PulG
LIVIVVVAVLASLTIVGLRSSRAAAAQSLMLSRARQHTAVMAQYANNHRDQFPFLVDPLLPSATFAASDGRRFTALFCDSVYAWNIALADAYYAGDSRSGVFAARGASRGHWANFRYLMAFYTRPEYWDLTTRQAAPTQFAPTTLSEVQFPAAKALLTERADDAMPISQRDLIVAFSDGHASPFGRLREDNPGPIPSESLSPRWTLVRDAWFGPFRATLGGIWGRDVR